MYEGLCKNESVSRRCEVVSENNTSQISNGIVGLVELNCHLETSAIVSDALYRITTCNSLFV